MRYYINDKEVDQAYFSTYNLTEPLVKIFSGKNIIGYTYNNLEELLNGKYKSKMEINKHLSDNLEKVEKAKQTLMKAGIIDKNGEITEQYKALKAFNSKKVLSEKECENVGINPPLNQENNKKGVDNLNSPLKTEMFEGIWSKMGEASKKEAEEAPLGSFGKRGKTFKYEKKGMKLNKNKPQLSLIFKQFPRALEAVVKCSEYGHEKYKEADQDYLNYKRVEGGSQTYADAGLRHRLEQGNDLESGLPHQFHVAWNALAELEIWIQENVK